MALLRKRLQRVGGSTGIVLGPEVLAEAGLERGDEILIHAERGRITVAPVSPIREEVLRAAETRIARCDSVFRTLAQ